MPKTHHSKAKDNKFSVEGHKPSPLRWCVGRGCALQPLPTHHASGEGTATHATPYSSNFQRLPAWRLCAALLFRAILTVSEVITLRWGDFKQLLDIKVWRWYWLVFSSFSARLDMRFFSVVNVLQRTIDQVIIITLLITIGLILIHGTARTMLVNVIDYVIMAHPLWKLHDARLTVRTQLSIKVYVYKQS